MPLLYAFKKQRVKTMDEMGFLKETAIKLAIAHKAQCNDPVCDISMTMVGVLLEKAGIQLMPAEWSELA